MWLIFQNVILSFSSLLYILYHFISTYDFRIKYCLHFFENSRRERKARCKTCAEVYVHIFPYQNYRKWWSHQSHLRSLLNMIEPQKDGSTMVSVSSKSHTSNCCCRSSPRLTCRSDPFLGSHGGLLSFSAWMGWIFIRETYRYPAW